MAEIFIEHSSHLESNKETIERLREYQESLAELDGYSNEVPNQRITHDLKKFPDYPYYKVQRNFILSLRRVFLEIANSGIVNSADIFDHLAVKVDAILLRMSALAFKGVENEAKVVLPEKIRNLLQQQLQSGQNETEALNTALEGYSSEQRERFFTEILQSGPQSRVPVEGEMPTDIVEQGSQDVGEMNAMIRQGIILLKKQQDPSFQPEYDIDGSNEGGAEEWLAEQAKKFQQ